MHYSGFNTNTKRQMWSISWGNLDGEEVPAGPATDSGLHDDLRWQNEQQHDYGPAWKPTGRDLPPETNICCTWFMGKVINKSCVLGISNDFHSR